jgi:Exo70 exocyst complex subunit
MYLSAKAINYTKDGRSDGQAKSNLFMMNNAFYLLDEMGPNSIKNITKDAEHYKIEGSWFVDKVNKIMDSEKAKYLGAWEQINTHLTAVANADLEYQKNDSTVLAHESGRLIKQRFSGFNEDFEVLFGLHLKVIKMALSLKLLGRLEHATHTHFVSFPRSSLLLSSFVLLTSVFAHSYSRMSATYSCHDTLAFTKNTRRCDSPRNINPNTPSTAPRRLPACS